MPKARRPARAAAVHIWHRPPKWDETVALFIGPVRSVSVSFAARAGGASVVIAVLPGLLVARLFGFRLRTLAMWSAVPVFSLGAVFALGEFTTVTHAPFGMPAFVVLVSVLGAAVAVRDWSRARGGSGWPVWELESDQPTVEPKHATVLAYALLVAGIAVGA